MTLTRCGLLLVNAKDEGNSPSDTVNSLSDDGLAAQLIRASAATVLTEYSHNFPVPALERLLHWPGGVHVI